MTGHTSIVIPCYRHGRFLDEAIESALSQTLSPKEVIVVDDGSDDEETGAKLAAWEVRREVIMLRQPNAGPAAARNTGIRRATGDWILCLDADDRLRQNFLERTEPVLAGRSEVGIVYGRAVFFGKKQGVVPLPPYRFPEVLLDPCIFSTALFRREDWKEVGGYRESMRKGWEDFDFWLSLIERDRKVVFLDEILFDYRTHEVSRDRSFTDERDQVLDVFVDLFHHHRSLYEDQIRLLFDAHLDRLDSNARWKEVFPEEALPELILDYSDGDRCIVQAESSLHSTENQARVAFALPVEKGVPQRVRLDPFSGPGKFSLREIQVQFEGDKTPRILDSGEWKVVRRSIGKNEFDVEENSSLIFLGSDPSLYLEFQAQALTSCPSMIYFDYCYEFGPPVRGWFLREWKEIEKNFPDLVEQVASLETELSHLKDELSREIERRRKIQSSRAYRWARGLQRLWGRGK